MGIRNSLGASYTGTNMYIFGDFFLQLRGCFAKPLSLQGALQSGPTQGTLWSPNILPGSAWNVHIWKEHLYKYEFSQEYNIFFRPEEAMLDNWQNLVFKF